MLAVRISHTKEEVHRYVLCVAHVRELPISIKASYELP